MNSWPTPSLESIRSELQNLEPADPLSIIQYDTKNNNDTEEHTQEQQAEQFLDMYKHVLACKGNATQLNYHFYTDYYNILNAVLSLDKLKFSDEDKNNCKNVLEEVQSFIKENNNLFKNITESSKNDIDQYITEFKHCTVREDYIAIMHLFLSYSPITISTSRLPSYKSILYPSLKQILADLLRDTFCINDETIGGSYGYQFITQKIISSITYPLGLSLDLTNPDFLLNVNEFNDFLAKNDKDNHCHIKEPPIISEDSSLFQSKEINTILNNTLDIHRLLYKLLHILSRSYTGEILYHALGIFNTLIERISLETLIPIQSSYYYSPDTSSQFPITLNTKLCLPKDSDNSLYLGFHTQVIVQACYLIKHRESQEDPLPYKIHLTYYYDSIQGLYEFKHLFNETEYVNVSIKSKSN